ncbi:MAG: heat-inducible transcription repressor HrcA [Deltaproteobacteria bacterium]|nr:heat-inducible transcription repressor HrcA [Deltaproteobacteria bacterium]
MDNRLTDRMKNILQTVIMQYIYTGEPMGSHVVSKKHMTALSPATIRNTMAVMEEMGYLMQPHPSSGRVPTDKGLRLYVDSILKIEELSKAEREKIKTKCQKSQEIERIMNDTSNILSAFSNCMGIVSPPRFDNIFIRHIEFIKLGKTQLMVLLISNSGIVQNRMVRIEKELKQHDLERMSGYLNDIARGLTLRKLKAKIIEKMEEEKTLYNQLLKKALTLSKIALDKDEDTDSVYVEGKMNMLNHPEFTKDIEKMKLLFRTFEEKSVLVKILDKAMDAEDIKIFIGSENRFNEIKGCSIVTAPYGSNGNILGTLGVIGPKRMNYSKVIPLVNYTASILSDIMARREAV